MLGWMTRKDIWIQKTRRCATGFGNELDREDMLRMATPQFRSNREYSTLHQMECNSLTNSGALPGGRARLIDKISSRVQAVPTFRGGGVKARRTSFGAYFVRTTHKPFSVMAENSQEDLWQREEFQSHQLQ